MTFPRAGRRRVGARGVIACAMAAAFGVGAAAVWSGCAVTRGNYKVLSFFFDGVPDPDAKAVAVGGQPGGAIEAIRRSPTYSAHRPFVEQQCDKCHASVFQLSRNNSGVCMTCHATLVSQYDRMHGPVAAGACLWCHGPHESAYAALLRDTPRATCVQCHTKGLLSARTVPEHADDARSCLECHFGHGGSREYFLRDGVSPAGGERK